MRPLPTFRQLILLLALGCVLPMAGLALGLVAYEYQRDRHQEEQHAVATARALIAGVDDRLEGVQRTLQGLANSPALAADDLGRLSDEAQAFVRTEQVRSVVLLDGDGRQLLNTKLPDGQALPADPLPGIREAVQGEGLKVLDLFRSLVSGRYVAGVGLPLPGGRTLAATLDPDSLREMLVRQKLPPSWIAAVLDRSGRIAARTHEHERFLGTLARPALVARIQQTPEDAVESTTVDGVPVVSAFSRSDRSGWSVVIGIPRTELVAPIVRTSAVLLAGTAAVLVLTLWLGWRLARSLSESVEALGSAVRATGHGAPVELPPAAFQEAQQLGQALLHASAEVQDATAAQRRLLARLQGVLDTAIDGIVTADARGRIVLFNRAAEAMFRLPQEDALGRDVESLLPPAARAGHRRLREQLTPDHVRQMAAGRIVEGLRSDGRAFRAQASISVSEEDGERLYTVILRPVRDVTRP
ncbi:MAG: PAS domain-containing protein [Burkholderiales bacterium]|nr:PAS domain-containing protein [Burkholderiales bacterium]